MTRSMYKWCAATAVALLLAGCGESPTGDSTTGSAALTKEQVGLTLPDGEAMTGWKQSFQPTAVEMDELYRSQACPVNDNAGCENSRFFGAAAFQRENPAASVTFQIVAYDSEEAAQEAYDVLWDGYYGNQVGLTGQKAKTLELGPIGDEHDARLGTSGFHGEPGAVTQTRVGTTLLWTMEKAAHKGDIDEDGIRDLVSMLAKRSQQAQNGNEPSAALNG
ncbi:hypothetical protein G3I32_21160 [Streptomyces coelicoflavus]|uniref:Uncharacterized protein n=1 Tax=Streptomyces coelicoflavus TaxID=285562 RepID=A0A7K3PQS2_9ACTN|nr:hypothetical protein [Streptomyces coelicoflavus]NEB11315.1 hypothetical protein [Streptomyces coelicoflavus]